MIATTQDESVNRHILETIDDVNVFVSAITSLSSGIDFAIRLREYLRPCVLCPISAGFAQRFIW